MEQRDYQNHHQDKRLDSLEQGEKGTIESLAGIKSDMRWLKMLVAGSAVGSWGALGTNFMGSSEKVLSAIEWVMSMFT